MTFSTGTGGTLAGVSMFLKSKNPKIKAVLADPEVRVHVYMIVSDIFFCVCVCVCVCMCVCVCACVGACCLGAERTFYSVGTLTH